MFDVHASAHILSLLLSFNVICCFLNRYCLYWWTKETLQMTLCICALHTRYIMHARTHITHAHAHAHTRTPTGADKHTHLHRLNIHTFLSMHACTLYHRPIAYLHVYQTITKLFSFSLQLDCSYCTRNQSLKHFMCLTEVVFGMTKP